MSAGVVSVDQLPGVVRERCGERRGLQLGSFINAVIDTVRHEGAIGMDARHAEALAAFRGFNYECIYLRGSSRDEALKVVSMLRALVEYFCDHPRLIPNVAGDESLTGSEAAKLRVAVEYVAGMTDRYACRAAASLLDWPDDQLPHGIDREG